MGLCKLRTQVKNPRHRSLQSERQRAKDTTSLEIFIAKIEAECHCSNNFIIKTTVSLLSRQMTEDMSRTFSFGDFNKVSKLSISFLDDVNDDNWTMNIKLGRKRVLRKKDSWKYKEKLG